MKEKVHRGNKDPKLVIQDSGKSFSWSHISNHSKSNGSGKVADRDAWPSPSPGSVLMRTSMLDSQALSQGELTAPVELRFKKDFMTMTENWTDEEKEQGRRLVQFKFISETRNKYLVDFEAMRKQDFAPNLPIISCIYWKEKNIHIVTSVDIIHFLECLAQDSFSIEEKNRIRRNLQSLKPFTISRTSKQCHRFFVMLMGMEDPTPRNIEKDLKVFKWEVLVDAISKVMSKYSINPAIDHNNFGEGKSQQISRDKTHNGGPHITSIAGKDSLSSSKDSSKTRSPLHKEKSKFKRLGKGVKPISTPPDTRDEIMDFHGIVLGDSNDLKGYDPSGDSMETESNSKDSSDSALIENKDSTPSIARSNGSTISAPSVESGFSLSSGLNSKSDSIVSNSNSYPSSGQVSVNVFSNGSSKQESQVTSGEGSVGTFAKVAGLGNRGNWFPTPGVYGAKTGSAAGYVRMHDARYYQYPALSQLYPAKVGAYDGCDMHLKNTEFERNDVAAGKPVRSEFGIGANRVELPSLMSRIKYQSLLGDDMIKLPPIVSEKGFESNTMGYNEV